MDALYVVNGSPVEEETEPLGVPSTLVENRNASQHTRCQCEACKQITNNNQATVLTDEVPLGLPSTL